MEEAGLRVSKGKVNETWSGKTWSGKTWSGKTVRRGLVNTYQTTSHSLSKHGVPAASSIFEQIVAKC